MTTFSHQPTLVDAKVSQILFKMQTRTKSLFSSSLDHLCFFQSEILSVSMGILPFCGICFLQVLWDPLNVILHWHRINVCERHWSMSVRGMVFLPPVEGWVRPWAGHNHQQGSLRYKSREQTGRQRRFQIAIAKRIKQTGSPFFSGEGSLRVGSPQTLGWLGDIIHHPSSVICHPSSVIHPPSRLLLDAHFSCVIHGCCTLKLHSWASGKKRKTREARRERIYIRRLKATLEIPNRFLLTLMVSRETGR